MTFETRRTAVAAALTSALGDTTVHAYLPTPLRAGSGWLAFKRADTEDSTYGDYRVTYDVVIALGTDNRMAETKFDDMAAALLDACSELGRGVSVSPLALNIDGTDFYCAVATLITEVEAT